MVMAGLAVESYIIDKPEGEKPVDREKTCPLLLRVFCRNGRHNSPEDYSRGNVPANESQIYTWMDATLREITSLMKEVNPDARKKGTVFDFSLVAPNMGPGPVSFRMRHIGTTTSCVKGADDNKTLANCRFQIGDYMDISITSPMRAPMDRERGPIRRGGPRGPY
ncbi:Histone deacetylase complex subunit SAP18 [Frankliniella fusca]|uniref:18 kDa Sin3-associated polypeptide n=1 Tax=Frankliniella fusca TaxID=407009 RepID=A0AAE1LK14_9NEOP|nr:Histone deacetylase complex subunit SAP18 [Frankliniella fusca]